MIYDNLFIDSDVILDLLLNREPFFPYIKLLFNESTNTSFKLNTSALIIANINYVLSKQVGQAAARESITYLIQQINILPFEKADIEVALTSEFNDFEDAIQYYIASKYNCQAIITRNIKDYRQSSIPVLTAEQFLRTIL